MIPNIDESFESVCYSHLSKPSHLENLQEEKLKKIVANIQSEPLNETRVKEIRVLLTDIYISVKRKETLNIIPTSEAYELEFEEVITSNISTMELVQCI